MNFQNQFASFNQEIYTNPLKKSNSPHLNQDTRRKQRYMSPQQALYSFPISPTNSGDIQTASHLKIKSNYKNYTKEELIHIIEVMEHKIHHFKQKLLFNKEKMLSLNELISQYEQNQKKLSRDQIGKIQKLQNYIEKVTNDYAIRVKELERENTEGKKNLELYKSCIRNLEIYGESKDREIKIIKQKDKFYSQQNRKIKEELDNAKKQLKDLVQQNQKINNQLTKLKTQTQTERQEYEARINQKENVIKKMSQFNNQICEKMIEEKYNLSSIQQTESYRNITNLLQIQQQNYQLKQCNFLLRKENQAYRRQMNIQQHNLNIYQDEDSDYINQNQKNNHHQNKKNDKLTESQCVLNTDRSTNTLRLELNEQQRFHTYSEYMIPDMNLTKPRFSHEDHSRNVQQDNKNQRRQIKYTLQNSTVQQTHKNIGIRAFQSSQWKSQCNNRKNGKIQWGIRKSQRVSHDHNQISPQQEQYFNEFKDTKK